ncbi:MAG: hypothetical protein QME62_11585, partial [Armatimonadota bacterium]|nr:hypothetical protein [Armatimonadota bacterium]
FIFLFGLAALADTEPTNNTRQRAEIIQPGTYSGTIGGKDEEDWYGFSVEGGDVIHVKLEPNSADDVKVELHNHEDSLLESCKPGKPLTYVTAAELGQRNWYLFVSAHKGGSYRFTLEVVPQNDAGTGKDAPAAFHKALPISGGVIKGMLGNDDEEDYFKFTASPGQTIVIEFKADFSRFDKTMDSIKLDLLAPYQSGLESVRSYGSKEVLTYGPLPENEAGEMRISVTGEGDYEFSIPLLGAGEPTLEKASPQVEQPAEETKDTAAGQTVNFGGSGQLKFFFSVKGEGTIKAQVQWNPQTQANIMLFSPGKKLPVAETKGTGSASLSYTVKAESGISGQLGKVVEAIESLKGADTNQWLLLITPQPPETVIQGQVTLEFPGSDSSRLEWRPFVPATDIGKAALSSYLNSVDRLTIGQAPGNES